MSLRRLQFEMGHLPEVRWLARHMAACALVEIHALSLWCSVRVLQQIFHTMVFSLCVERRSHFTSGFIIVTWFLCETEYLVVLYGGAAASQRLSVVEDSTSPQRAAAQKENSVACARRERIGFVCPVARMVPRY